MLVDRGPALEGFPSAPALRHPLPTAVLDDGKLWKWPTQCDPFEFSHDSLEPLASQLATTQCSAEIGPIQDLRARRRQRWRDSSFQE
jgi:hypothetical protein